MPGRASWLAARWQDPAQPLHLALVFQAVVFVLAVGLDLPLVAAPLVGGTVGCVLASLRLQRKGRPSPD